ncbi:MAG: VPLPA-CTERM sorting domain-containing protein [Pseudomonadota bacterium]
MKRTILGMSAAIAGFFFTHANAGVITGEVTGGDSGGSLVVLNPNVNDVILGTDTLQSPDIFVFEESTMVVTEDIALEFGGLSVGDTVTSFIVAFDPEIMQTISGMIDFGADIVGIASSDETLAATMSFENALVNYLFAVNNVGLETRDSLSVNGGVLDFSLLAISPIDVIRVFTATELVTPLPAAFWMFLAGVGALGAAKRRKRAR